MRLLRVGSGTDRVLANQEAESRKGAPNAILKGNLDALNRMFDEDSTLSEFRGVFGESLLHLAYLYHEHDSPNLCARTILRRAPHLITSVYESETYQGENALHMAIANENIEEARFLVGLCPELVHGHAVGTFFQRPEADFDSLKVKAYYGETPLGFAVSTNQPAMVRFLVEAGARISDADQYGNTAAHIAVYHKRTEMYLLLQKLWDQGLGRPEEMRDEQMSTLRNEERYTPISYAAAIHVTDKDTFRELWDSTKRKVWSWGAISCETYPLDLVDSVGEVLPSPSEQLLVDKANEERPWYESIWRALIGKQYDEVPTALSAAIDNQNMALLSDNNMKSLVNKKWETFGRSKFYSHLFFSLFFIALIWYWTVVLQKSPEPSDAAAPERTASELLSFPWDFEKTGCTLEWTWENLFRCSKSPVEWMIVLYAGANLITSMRMMFRVGLDRYFDFYGAGWLQTLPSLLASFLILIACALEVSGRNYEWNYHFDVAPPSAEVVVVGNTSTSDFSNCPAPMSQVVMTEVMTEVCKVALREVSKSEDENDANYSVSRILLSVASLLLYIHFASFLLGFQATGPFIIMVVKIIRNDLILFLGVLIVFVLGFSQFFYIMQYGGGGGQPEGGVGDYLEVLRHSFSTMLDSAVPETRDFWVFAPAIIYIVVATVTLLNILVAMLNDTYTNVRQDADNQYLLELARMLLLMEKGMSKGERLRDKYWSIDDKNRPSLMVEKSNEVRLASDERRALVTAQTKMEEENIRLGALSPLTPRMDATASPEAFPITTIANASRAASSAPATATAEQATPAAATPHNLPRRSIQFKGTASAKKNPRARTPARK